jgi:hypothetical protein
MKRNIIIDYLNITSAIKLINKEKGSSVKALFRPQSKIIEFFLIKIITLFKISYTLDKMSSANLTENIANDIHHKVMVIAREISKEYINNPSSKVNECLNFSLSSWLFNALWRQVSIIEYVGRLNTHPDVLYIATQLNNRILMKSSFYQAELKNSSLVHYKSSSFIDDQGYGYIAKRPKLKYLGKRISNLLECIYFFFFIKLRKKPINTKISMLTFVHSKTHNWLSIDKFIEDSALDVICLPPTNKFIDEKFLFNIKSIDWKDMFSFYKHMIAGVNKFYWSISINLNLFSELLQYWKFVYIFESLFNRSNIKIVLSGFESPISKMATAVASDNDEMASFDCLWSIGERPHEFAFTQKKMSDRFFLWGQWHYDLMRASNDKSSGYIISGYIGDNNIPLMKSIGQEFRKKNLKKFNRIITVFDSGSSEEGWYSKEVYIEYLKTILFVAKEFNALVVLKLKKGDERYADIIKSNDDGHLITQNEKGSLVTALNSEVVIGVATSGPVSVSAVHGSQVILYDPTRVVWNQWELNKHSIPLIKTLTDLQTKLEEVMLNETQDVTLSPKYIDPYGDYKAQKRMVSYIKDVFSNIHLGKNKAIHLADNNYKKQWGDDKVIIKENSNKGLNEKNNIR